LNTPRHLGAALALASLTMTISCSSGGNEPSSSASTPQASSPAATGATPAAGGGASTASFQEGRDYTVLERARFLDTMGFEQPAEAFSVLVPRGWKHEGGVQWKSPQQCRSEMVTARWSVSSPDGAIRFLALPLHAWGYASDPMMLQSMHMQAQQGGCEVAQPINAEVYVRQVMAPRELPGAAITEIAANVPARQELERMAGENRAKLMQYGAQQVDFGIDAVTVRLRWDDGTEGIALCSVVNIITTMQNAFTGEMQRLSTSVASERSVLRFAASRRAEAETFLANLKASYRTNPEWKAAIDGYMERMRRQQDAVHHQRMQALADQTAANARAHAQRMADIQAQGAANTQRFEQRMAAMDQNMRSWEARQASQDRAHTSFVQAIREVETWQGSDGRVELSSGYDQAWARGDGTYILSNSPTFDPRTVFQDQAWQELKRTRP
jgi:hypothetical protein